MSNALGFRKRNTFYFSMSLNKRILSVLEPLIPNSFIPSPTKQRLLADDYHHCGWGEGEADLVQSRRGQSRR